MNPAENAPAAIIIIMVPPEEFVLFGFSAVDSSAVYVFAGTHTCIIVIHVNSNECLPK